MVARSSRERILEAYPLLEPADVDDALASAAWRMEERAGTRLLNSQRKAVGPPYRSRVGQDGRMSDQGVLGWAGCTAVERDPQRVSGAWLFRGTRIPVAALFENLEDGTPWLNLWSFSLE
jgi:uncharacterized protein (DUF433 family)